MLKILVVFAVIWVLGEVILRSIRKIPVTFVGHPTFLGKRAEGENIEPYGEGWGIFLGYPWLYSFVLICMQRVSFEVVSPKTRTPDRAESKVPILITFSPDPKNLNAYIRSGQEEGVRKQLTGKILERIREWAMSSDEGPADWVELNRSHLEAVYILARHLATSDGSYFGEIPQETQGVPTWVWMRFFGEPQPTPNEKNKWEKDNWVLVREKCVEIEKNFGRGPLENLRGVLEDRKKKAGMLRTGVGRLIMPDLGIIVERLNIGDIDVLGEVGKQAEGEAKEEQERQAEEKEIKFVKKRVRELMDEFNLSAHEALEAVQIERKKITKSVDKKEISLDATTLGVVNNFLERRK